MASCRSWLVWGCTAWEALLLGVRPQLGELGPALLTASKPHSLTASQPPGDQPRLVLMATQLQKQQALMQTFSSLCLSHWPKQATWPGPAWKGKVLASLPENWRGRVTLQTGVHTGWETFVAKCFSLPHLFLMKAFLFYSCSFPRFSSPFHCELRLYVSVQVPLQKNVYIFHINARIYSATLRREVSPNWDLDLSLLPIFSSLHSFLHSSLPFFFPFILILYYFIF